MKRLWKVIDDMHARKSTKNTLYVSVLMLVSIGLGGMIWGTLGRWFLPGTDWLLCFMGYPAVFLGFLGGVLYLYNHEFS